MSGVKVKIYSTDTWEIYHLCKFELLPPFKANVPEYRVKQQKMCHFPNTYGPYCGSSSYFPAEDPLKQDSNQPNTQKIQTSR